MEIQLQIRDLHVFTQNLFFRILLLILSSQIKALFINLTNQNKVLRIKIKQVHKSPVKACFRDSCKAQYLQ